MEVFGIDNISTVSIRDSESVDTAYPVRTYPRVDMSNVFDSAFDDGIPATEHDEL
jgi:hypothetical protein